MVNYMIVYSCQRAIFNIRISIFITQTQGDYEKAHRYVLLNAKRAFHLVFNIQYWVATSIMLNSDKCNIKYSYFQSTLFYLFQFQFQWVHFMNWNISAIKQLLNLFSFFRLHSSLELALIAQLVKIRKAPLSL